MMRETITEIIECPVCKRSGAYESWEMGKKYIVCLLEGCPKPKQGVEPTLSEKIEYNGG